MEDRRIHRVGCVVTDELHLLGDSRRGYLLEVLLTKLLYLNRRCDRWVRRSLPSWETVGRRAGNAPLPSN